MLRVNRFVFSLLLVGAIASAGKPLAAETVADCYDKVLTKCADAMDGAKWYEKVALGILCSAMLAGCNTTVTL
jgi:hypothetical protein